MSDKEYVKTRLIEFRKKHKDFDDRNTKDINEAKELLDTLVSSFSLQTVIGAIEELRKEYEERSREAMERFNDAIAEWNNRRDEKK